ncbi:MAG: hypothetical protein K6G07_00470, partial [Lachnospiraceae bacterium]|nr:hypothetical protein [Lachnospiraceae bacterium]
MITEWTKYETLWLILELLIIAGYVLGIVKKKWKAEVSSLLVLFAALGFGVALYSALTVGQVRLDGDGAASVLLAKCQMQYHNLLPKEWCSANGELWVLGLNTWTIPFAAAMKNLVLARTLGAMVSILLACMGIVLLTRKFFNDSSFSIAVPVMFLGLSGGQARHQILYESGYTSMFFWISFYLLFAYAFLRWKYPKERMAGAIAYGLFMFLSSIGGPR